VYLLFIKSLGVTKALRAPARQQCEVAVGACGSLGRPGKRVCASLRRCWAGGQSACGHWGKPSREDLAETLAWKPGWLLLSCTTAGAGHSELRRLAVCAGAVSHGQLTGAGAVCRTLLSGAPR